MSELDFAAGTQIDRYVIDKFLGKGGMAVVYSVHHAQLGTPHALKLLTTPSESVRKRLLQEGRVQAQLRHPNIVAVSDVITYDGAPGLVMEYIQGPALNQLLAETRLSIEQADSLARGIIAGVAAAHNNSVIHRDLKPANILLKITPSGLIPKVADFGLVKVVKGDEPTSHTMTQTGMALGTPAYMAPEQIRDTRNVDLRADIFSLGAILYEMVCGQLAFQGDDLMDLLTSVVSGDFTPPNELVANIPPRIEKAILGCLAVDKDERIADCDSLLKIWTGGETEAERVPIDVSSVWSGGMLEKATALGAGEMETSELDFRSAGSSSNEIKTAALDDDALQAELGDSFEAVTGRVRPTKARHEPETISVPASNAPKLILMTVLLGGIAAGGFFMTRGSGEDTTPTEVNQDVENTAEIGANTAAQDEGPTGADEDAALTPDPDEAEVGTDVPVTVAPQAVPKVTPKVQPTQEAATSAEEEALPAEEEEVAEPVEEEIVEKVPSTTASFSFSGAKNVWLRSTSGKLLSPGEVPPGHYSVRADFGEGSQVVKEVDLVIGQHVAFVCDSFFKTCE